MALTVAQTDWLQAKANNEVVGVMAFDLSAAFDTLSHSIILSKLESAGISGMQLKWFQSYLDGRSQRVLWNDTLSKPNPLDRGVPQGSILGPILFLVMIHDMPRNLLSDTSSSSSRVIGYADDTTVYIKARNIEELKSKFEEIAKVMVNYCNDNDLVLNKQKTQILTSSKSPMEIKVGNDLVSSSKSISLLGLEYDENFSTAPYLHNLAREAKTRAALIHRLSFGMPNCVLKQLTSGLLMGKILSAAPAAIPIQVNPNDKPYLSTVMNDIEKSIRATARTITRTRLSDKVKSEIVLQRAGLPSLTEAVSKSMATEIWRARKEMNPLGRIFSNRVSMKNTRSASSNKLCQPVPGHPESAANKLAQLWNVSNLSDAKTLGNARHLVSEWYKQRT